MSDDNDDDGEDVDKDDKDDDDSDETLVSSSSLILTQECRPSVNSPNQHILPRMHKSDAAHASFEKCDN